MANPISTAAHVTRMPAVELYRSYLSVNLHPYGAELVNPAASTFVADFCLLSSTSRFPQDIPFFSKHA